MPTCNALLAYGQERYDDVSEQLLIYSNFCSYELIDCVHEHVDVWVFLSAGGFSAIASEV